MYPWICPTVTYAQCVLLVWGLFLLYPHEGQATRHEVGPPGVLEPQEVPPEDPPTPPAPTGPIRYYVCGNATIVAWHLETRVVLDHLVGTTKCPFFMVLVRIPDEHLDAQRALGARLPARHMKLIAGLMVEKTPEERQAIDDERERFMHEKRRERAERARLMEERARTPSLSRQQLMEERRRARARERESAPVPLPQH